MEGWRDGWRDAAALGDFDRARCPRGRKKVQPGAWRGRARLRSPRRAGDPTGEEAPGKGGRSSAGLGAACPRGGRREAAAARPAGQPGRARRPPRPSRNSPAAHRRAGARPRRAGGEPRAPGLRRLPALRPPPGRAQPSLPASPRPPVPAGGWDTGAAPRGPCRPGPRRPPLLPGATGGPGRRPWGRLRGLRTRARKPSPAGVGFRRANLRPALGGLAGRGLYFFIFLFAGGWPAGIYIIPLLKSDLFPNWRLPFRFLWQHHRRGRSGGLDERSVRVSEGLDERSICAQRSCCLLVAR